MREAIRRKITQTTIILLILSVLLPTLTILASGTSRYNQNGMFEASGSPLLNPHFTTDQWNKWEIVAWGVFLSNFVVPMVDSYETAFSTNSASGSRGSGYKALAFSTGNDSGSSNVLSNFLQFALDQATTGQFKPLFTSYYYLTSRGEVVEQKNGE
jgi:hypothetical protein